MGALNRKPARGLILGLAALASLALGAVPAQAVEIVPGDTAILGQSSNAKFEYAGSTITCNSEIGGRTTKPASPIANLTSMTFKECANGGLTTLVTVNASATNQFPLVATKALGGGNGEGYLEIPSAGTVIVRVWWGIILACEFTASGSQTLPGAFDSGKDIVSFSNALVSVKRTGGIGNEEQCGPDASTAKFSAEYAMEPKTLEVK
jgi:hypothetical protein